MSTQASHPNQDLQDLTQARQGDDSAFERLVLRYQDRIAATVIGMLGPGQEADDAGQEVFIRFHRKLDSFRGEARLSTYLTRIAMNISLDRLRSRSRWMGRMLGLEQDELGSLEPRFEQEAYLDERERAELVQEAVRALRPSWRSVVVLRLLQNYSTLETAELLGIPKGTVLSRLARASSALREHLGPLMERTGKEST